MTNIKNLIFALGASATLAGCVEAPVVERPVTKEYEDNFIKQFGSIPPTQDWKMVASQDVAIIAENTYISLIDVYIHACERYFRVASYHDISRSVTLHVDVPKGNENLYVVIDGQGYVVAPNGIIDVDGGAVLSRADVVPNTGALFDPSVLSSKNPEDMSWLIVAEDLGDTDDFDFNDFIAKIEFVTIPGSFSVIEDPWTLITNTEGVVLSSPSRAANVSSNTTPLKITALAAGGVKSLFLHYTPDGTTDYIIGPNGAISASSVNDGNENLYEWHNWFEGVEAAEDGKHAMINTGGNSSGTIQAVTKPCKTTTLESTTLGDFTYSYYSLTQTNNNVVAPVLGFYLTVGTYSGLEKTYGGQIAIGQVVGACNSGAAPQMFLIPNIGWTSGGWHWPKERVQINDAYHYFIQWKDTDTYNVGSSSIEYQWYTEAKVSDASSNTFDPSSLTIIR